MLVRSKTRAFELSARHVRQGHGYAKIKANLRVHAFCNCPPHLVVINVGIRFTYDPRADDFAVFRIWDRNYRGFSYGRMLGQGVLDLYREKVLLGNFD